MPMEMPSAASARDLLPGYRTSNKTPKAMDIALSA